MELLIDKFDLVYSIERNASSRKHRLSKTPKLLKFKKIIKSQQTCEHNVALS